LRRQAGDDLDRLQAAGLLLIRREWCWDDFARTCAARPAWTWALDVLVSCIVEGDESVPDLLLRHRAEAKAEGGGA
jgi:hypothetical protein